MDKLFQVEEKSVNKAKEVLYGVWHRGPQAVERQDRKEGRTTQKDHIKF